MLLGAFYVCAAYMEAVLEQRAAEHSVAGLKPSGRGFYRMQQAVKDAWLCSAHS